MKPFLTIDQQIELLKSRGMEVDIDAESVLLRESYYSLVNGYKEPFLDIEKTKSMGDDIYIEGSKFSGLYSTFLFDRQLRELTFKYLIRAEAVTRSAISYCFSQTYPEPNSYLLHANYCEPHEFRQPENHTEELLKLTISLSRIADHSFSPYITHYRNVHKEVPLWVMANNMTFGVINHFYCLMKPAERNEVCKTITKAVGRLGDKKAGYFSSKEAVVALEVLHKFRNICAHDERLYSTTIGGRKRVDYYRMIHYLRRFLTEEDFIEYLGALSDITLRFSELGDFTSKVVNFRKLEHLYSTFIDA